MPKTTTDDVFGPCPTRQELLAVNDADLEKALRRVMVLHSGRRVAFRFGTRSASFREADFALQERIGWSVANRLPLEDARAIIARQGETAKA